MERIIEALLITAALGACFCAGWLAWRTSVHVKARRRRKQAESLLRGKGYNRDRDGIWRRDRAEP